jgi:hypothetical protein
MPAIRRYTFPSRQNLSNFMGLVNKFTGWTLDGYYPDLDKPQSGRVLVTQANPYARVCVEWRTEGKTVTLDLTVLELHFDAWNRDRAIAHLRQLANWQGAGVC